MNVYMICKRLDGNYTIMDEVGDLPLVTVLFHNEAAHLPDEIKATLVRQMVDPKPAPRTWKDVLFILGLSVLLSISSVLAFQWFVR